MLGLIFFFCIYLRASSVPIFNVSVTGVSEAFEKIKSKGTIKDAKVKASLSVSESGEFKVDDVFVQAEITKGVVGSITDSVLSFFGGKKKDVGANGEDGSDDGDASADGGNAAASADDQKVTSTATSTSTTSKTTNSDSIADDVNNVTDKVVNEKIRLDFKVDLLTVVPMTKADFDAIASRYVSTGLFIFVLIFSTHHHFILPLLRIADMDAADYKIKQRDEARNNLESFMYTVRDLMESTTAESVSTPESRQSLKEALDVVREFLDEDGDSAPIDDILVKDSLVRTIWEPIDLRRTEKLKRPDSIAILQKALLEAKQLMSEVTTKNEALIQEISVAQEKWEKYLEEERVKDEEEASSVAAAAASSSSADSAEGHDSSSTSIDDKEKETPVSDEENSSSSSSASITPTSATITSTRSRLPSPKPTPTFGREDLEQVSQLVNSSDEWLTKKIQEQDAIADTESPVLLSQDINAKNAAVAKEMNRISEMSKRFFKMSSKPKKDKAKKPLKASSAEKKAKEDARKEDEAAAAAADKEDQAAGSGGGGTTHDEL